MKLVRLVLATAAVIIAACVAHWPDTWYGFLCFMCTTFFGGAGAHAIFGGDE